VNGSWPGSGATTRRKDGGGREGVGGEGASSGMAEEPRGHSAGF
jgi:hypothetical protein